MNIDREYIKLLSAVADNDNPPYWFEGRDDKRDPLLVELKDAGFLRAEFCEDSVMAYITYRGRLELDRLVNKILKEKHAKGNREMCKYLRCKPEVFKIPECNQSSSLVALMMPFDKSFDAVSNAIKEAATSLSLECKRGDDIWEEPSIMQDVFNLIYTSVFVVCDFSGRNPNVFYEAGIAHTLGRDVIPIVQNIKDIPFDLQSHRAIQYLPNNEGLDALKTAIVKRMKTILKKHYGATNKTSQKSEQNSSEALTRDSLKTMMTSLENIKVPFASPRVDYENRPIM